MKEIKVGVLVGSLRQESFNRKAANALIEVAPSNLKFEFIDISHLELYNQEYDEKSPESYVAFREKVKSKDAILFVTPEYNRSVPGVLKNAIDIASRPWGQSVWAQKSAAIVSVTIGNVGAFGANHHLRQSLMFLDMPVMAQPEAYINDAMNLFDESGKLVNEGTKAYFTDYMKAFANFIDHNLR